jgi:hypothetical protein
MTIEADRVMPHTAIKKTWLVVTDPNIVRDIVFIMNGETTCPKLMKQVKQAAPIAVATGFTAFEISTIARGINIPCEKPHNTAPVINKA